MCMGIVFSYNKKIGAGLLRDSNSPKIKFFNKQPNYFFLVNDIVRYEISLNSYGLIAVGGSFSYRYQWGNPKTSHRFPS